MASDAVSDVLAEVLRLRAAIRDAVSLIEIDRYFAARDRLEDALAGIPRAADVTEGEGG